MKTRSGSQQRPKKNYNLQYDVCKLKGHTKETCYKVVGYPKENKFWKKYNPQTIVNLVAKDGPMATTFSTPIAPTFAPEQYQ